MVATLLVEQQAGDEKSRNREKDVHTDEPAGASRGRMKEHDENNGDRPQAVDIRAIGAGHHGLRAVSAHARICRRSAAVPNRTRARSKKGSGDI